ncbi:RNA-binding protein [Actinoplanes subtropicus]|uniref:RNA-binding protein n=1 Tax=Actinoplanes subtropicus TaxID=543632 RepID=UPI001FE147F6|nr:RNA-binding protein [Actinoplanes subtropicus]
MPEYSWPEDGERLCENAADRWAETVEALPEGSIVTGRVIGRQPFGVFVDISGTPGAIGLAEITSMPHDAALPQAGGIVRGTVIGHAAHNHQVRLRLHDS